MPRGAVSDNVDYVRRLWKILLLCKSSIRKIIERKPTVYRVAALRVCGRYHDTNVIGDVARAHKSRTGEDAPLAPFLCCRIVWYEGEQCS